MILSIETSCDDTSMAVTDIKKLKLLLNCKKTQEAFHSPHGGVVPELASRLHLDALCQQLEMVKPFFVQLKAIAVTTNPGLSITLLEGLNCAKALCVALKLPLIEVNHLKGHIYSLFIEKKARMPLTVLLISGGHTMLLEVQNFTDIHIVVTSYDDSFGESFDKVAKMLGLGYPGGPIVERLATHGDKNRFNFPVPLQNSGKIEFSYSGLKSAIRVQIETLKKQSGLKEQDKKDLCACFQKVAIRHLTLKCKQYFNKQLGANKVLKSHFAIVGGASANMKVREAFEKLGEDFGFSMSYASLPFCSDNAAMIGRAAVEQFRLGKFASLHKSTVATKAIF